jgi:hypothetical protein
LLGLKHFNYTTDNQTGTKEKKRKKNDPDPVAQSGQ